MVVLVNALPGICVLVEGSRKGTIRVPPFLDEAVPVLLRKTFETRLQSGWEGVFLRRELAECAEGDFVFDGGAPVDDGAEDVEEEGFDVGEG